jgi:hypothetical protein
MTGTSDAFATQDEDAYEILVETTATTTSKGTSSPDMKDLEAVARAGNRTKYYQFYVTDPQVRHLEKAAKTKAITYAFASGQPPARVVQLSIGELPRKKIVTTFEPHLRQASLRKLRTLVDEFAVAIGHPEAAVVKDELRSELTETYKRTIGAQDTRNFASAISILQDFLRPHWSVISSDKLRAVSERLGWLGAQDKLDARLLDKFFSDMKRIFGGRIVFESTEDAFEDEQEE